jgi:hypothetical protein
VRYKSKMTVIEMRRDEVRRMLIQDNRYVRERIIRRLYERLHAPDEDEQLAVIFTFKSKQIESALKEFGYDGFTIID